MTTGTVAVIGSLNVDLITITPRVPEAGETITASSSTTGFGGKGANQAVACARLSDSKDGVHALKTMMVGQVGSDSFGQDYVEALGKEDIDTRHVKVMQGAKTGTATILVEERTGENRILVATNANHAELEQARDLVPDEADVVVFQLEIPPGQVVHNCKIAHDKGKYVILNPSPAVDLPDAIFQTLDCIVVNETEAELLCKGQDLPWHEYFFSRGLRHVAIRTLGSRGAEYATRAGDVFSVAAERVKVVDTTAAGDTFVGALAGQLCGAGSRPLGADPGPAVRFANKAAAKTVGKRGAMDAIPRRSEVMD